jgi:hypothetical protein
VVQKNSKLDQTASKANPIHKPKYRLLAKHKQALHKLNRRDQLWVQYLVAILLQVYLTNHWAFLIKKWQVKG